MTLKATLKQLKDLGDAKVRAQNAKVGAGDDQFGVALGDIRKVAKKIKTDLALALERGCSRLADRGASVEGSFPVTSRTRLAVRSSIL